MEQDDFLTHGGATILANRIKTYWTKHGYAGIKTYVVEERSSRYDNHGEILWGVRSNIGTNGYPPKEQINGTPNEETN